MSKKTVISVEDLSKIYSLYEKPIDRLKESLSIFGKRYHKDFFALKDINFSVKNGETLGIIGKNGSGKSTLLKILTGVLSPSAGKVDVEGKVSALLELGAGFNPEYTGIENIYLNGTLMGFTKQEIEGKLDDILAFADIGEFAHQPVKVYSSGMFVRLAFAVAINVEPDILIVDEALSVGDIRFQQKCLRKIDQFRNSKTVIFVTHDLGTISKFCSRAIWLNEGQLMEDGNPESVEKKYRAYMMGSELRSESFAKKKILSTLDNNIDFDATYDIVGDGKAIISGAALIDRVTGRKVETIQGGQRVRVLIRVTCNQPFSDLIVGFTLKDRLGNIVTQTNSFVINGPLEAEIGVHKLYSFDFLFPELNDGTYTISPAVASGSQEEHTQHCWVHDAIVVRVNNRSLYNLEGFMILRSIEFQEFDQ